MRADDSPRLSEPFWSWLMTHVDTHSARIPASGSDTLRSTRSCIAFRRRLEQLHHRRCCDSACLRARAVSGASLNHRADRCNFHHGRFSQGHLDHDVQRRPRRVSRRGAKIPMDSPEILSPSRSDNTDRQLASNRPGSPRRPRRGRPGRGTLRAVWQAAFTDAGIAPAAVKIEPSTLPPAM